MPVLEKPKKKPSKKSKGMIFFGPDEKVIWNPVLKGDSQLEELMRVHGPGPFTVADVDICGTEDCKCVSLTHRSACHKGMALLLGHPQWLFLRSPDGELIEGPGNMGPLQLSGRWFARI